MFIMVIRLDFKMCDVWLVWLLVGDQSIEVFVGVWVVVWIFGWEICCFGVMDLQFCFEVFDGLFL